MFGRKVEILVLFIFVFFSAVSAVAAIKANEANTVTEANAVAEGRKVFAAGTTAAKRQTNVVTDVNMVTKGDESSTAILVAKQGELLSSLTARTFYDIGYELYTDKKANFLAARQALIFFNAAVSLDNKASYVLADIINIAWQYPDRNFSDAVRLAMSEYIDRSADLEISSKAVGYLLERLDSREQRQKLLTNLLDQFQPKNDMFASDILTQLGFLTAETADTTEAQRYLVQAFSANKYNRLAFAKFAELAEAGGQQLPDISYLQNLRFAIRANPLDFDSALRFAQYTQVLGLYGPASAAYKYCADLLKYLSGPNSVGPDIYPHTNTLMLGIYRPWMFNCFNARQYDQCRQILQMIRDSGIFDVQAEAIALAASLQSYDKQGSEAILDGIKARSNKILAGQLKVSSAELEDLTWFYSFVADANSEEILTWATKVYDAEPNSLNAASLFAYALAMNNQAELAEPMLEKIGTATQAAGLAKALVYLKKEDKNSAIDLLKKVVEIQQGSFEAQKAKQKLKELGSEYEPPDSSGIITELQSDFGQAFFSQFVEPQNMASLQLSTKGSTFSYGSEITGNLVIMNNYSEPMVVCPDAMIKGNIRIDVKITGDLTEQIPALIVKTVRPSYEIRPGDALFIPLRLDTGPVKRILDCHPQAQLNLEYTAYLDPQPSENSRIKSALPVKPAKAVLTRSKLNLDTRYLQQRLDAMKKGHQGQKIKSVQLFAGLLAEQQKLRQTGPAYRFIYTEPQLLSSALAKCLAEDDWVLKAQTIAAMLKLKLDYRLTEAVSEELNNPNWPVRLIAVFILAQNKDQKFQPVLSWTAKNDSNPQVRQLAAILSGSVETDNNNSNLQPNQEVKQEVKQKPEQKAKQEPAAKKEEN